MNPLLGFHGGIADLCRRFRVARLEVFGSAARDNFDPQRSDVDLLVSFLPGETDLDHFLGLAEGLEALLGRRVDLVIERAIRNPYFRQTVEASRRLIYAHSDQEAAV
jgi:predicted nucleotidyltransferase